MVGYGACLVMPVVMMVVVLVAFVVEAVPDRVD